MNVGLMFGTVVVTGTTWAGLSIELESLGLGAERVVAVASDAREAALCRVISTGFGVDWVLTIFR